MAATTSKQKQAGSQKGVTLEPHQIILRPLVTEKGMHRSTRYNQYAFEVNPLATKIDIRNAVEVLFEDVTVLPRLGKKQLLLSIPNLKELISSKRVAKGNFARNG